MVRLCFDLRKMMLPFSAAAENNKRPILEKLRDAFKDATRVLEIASGTG